MSAGGFLAVHAIEKNPRTNLDYVDPHNEIIGGIWWIEWLDDIFDCVDASEVVAKLFVGSEKCI